jgi:hypothetical protein
VKRACRCETLPAAHTPFVLRILRSTGRYVVSVLLHHATVNDREVCMCRKICVRMLVVEVWKRGCLRCMLVGHTVTACCVTSRCVSKFQNARQTRTGRNMVKSSSPNALSTRLIFVYPRTHAKTSESLTFIRTRERKYNVNVQCSVQYTSLLLYLMLVISVRKLSIKLYRIYVCYTNIALCTAFGIIGGFT